MPLEIRPVASTDELRAAERVRHVAYRKKLPLLAYSAAMYVWRQGRTGTPWIVRDGGEVVATLLCHDQPFALDGAVLPGYALGSVATLPEHQRHGHASALCATVCETMERAGRGVGLLFAAIRPSFYARIGFVAIPAWSWRCDRVRELADDGPAADLVPADPRGDAEALAAAWRAFHAGRLHPHRDTALHLRSVADEPDTWFFTLGDDAARGYVRVARNDDSGTLEILEPIVLDPADELPALRAVARLAASMQSPAITGWLEPSDAVRTWFAPASRDDTLPMLRGAPPHARCTVWGTDHV